MDLSGFLLDPQAVKGCKKTTREDLRGRRTDAVLQIDTYKSVDIMISAFSSAFYPL